MPVGRPHHRQPPDLADGCREVPAVHATARNRGARYSGAALDCSPSGDASLWTPVTPIRWTKGGDTRLAREAHEHWGAWLEFA